MLSCVEVHIHVAALWYSMDRAKRSFAACFALHSLPEYTFAVSLEASAILSHCCLHVSLISVQQCHRFSLLPANGSLLSIINTGGPPRRGARSAPKPAETDETMEEGTEPKEAPTSTEQAEGMQTD